MKKGGDKEPTVRQASNERGDFGCTSWVCGNSVVLPDTVKNA